MCPLSNRPGSKSNILSPRGNDCIKETFGWDDPEPTTNLDGYAKNKNLNASIIKLANSRVSLLSVLQRYKLELREQYSPSGWTQSTNCPFSDHKDETPSFGFNSKEDLFHCFGCNRSGRAVQFIAFIENRSQLEVAKNLLSKIPIEDVIVEIEVFEDKIYELLFECADSISVWLKSHEADLNAIKYLEVVTWPLDAFVRTHLADGSIDVEQLEARVRLHKTRLYDYGEE